MEPIDTFARTGWVCAPGEVPEARRWLYVRTFGLLNKTECVARTPVHEVVNSRKPIRLILNFFAPPLFADGGDGSVALRLWLDANPGPPATATPPRHTVGRSLYPGSTAFSRIQALAQGSALPYEDSSRIDLVSITEMHDTLSGDGIDSAKAMMWHGTDEKNIAGILASGLQLPADDESPGALGRAIYLSKSANTAFWHSKPEFASATEGVRVEDELYKKETRVRAKKDFYNLADTADVGAVKLRDIEAGEEGTIVAESEMDDDGNPTGEWISPQPFSADSAAAAGISLLVQWDRLTGYAAGGGFGSSSCHPVIDVATEIERVEGGACEVSTFRTLRATLLLCNVDLGESLQLDGYHPELSLAELRSWHLKKFDTASIDAAKLWPSTLIGDESAVFEAERIVVTHVVDAMVTFDRFASTPMVVRLNPDFLDTVASYRDSTLSESHGNLESQGNWALDTVAIDGLSVERSVQALKLGEWRRRLCNPRVTSLWYEVSDNSSANMQAELSVLCELLRSRATNINALCLSGTGGSTTAGIVVAFAEMLQTNPPLERLQFRFTAVEERDLDWVLDILARGLASNTHLKELHILVEQNAEGPDAGPGVVAFAHLLRGGATGLVSVGLGQSLYSEAVKAFKILAAGAVTMLTDAARDGGVAIQTKQGGATSTAIQGNLSFDGDRTEAGRWRMYS